MANVKAAIDYVMRDEDRKLSGIITNYPDDPGGVTRFGQAKRWHPALAQQGFYDCEFPDAKTAEEQNPAIPVDRAIVMAESSYETNYAAALYLERIASQAIATALLSFAVVEGTYQAVRQLQKALCSIGTHVDVDGVPGPSTLAAENAADAPKLLTAWIALEDNYFAGLGKPVFLKGWENRAAELKSLVGGIA